MTGLSEEKHMLVRATPWRRSRTSLGSLKQKQCCFGMSGCKKEKYFKADRISSTGNLNIQLVLTRNNQRLLWWWRWWNHRKQSMRKSTLWKVNVFLVLCFKSLNRNYKSYEYKKKHKYIHKYITKQPSACRRVLLEKVISAYQKLPCI